jgi:benzodiazapine receptor
MKNISRWLLKCDLPLVGWIGGLFVSCLGAFVQKNTNWYHTLKLSPLTPPDYVFDITWMLLCALIGTGGWLIWRCPLARHINILKSMYFLQLLCVFGCAYFFNHHRIGLTLIALALIALCVAVIMIGSWQKKPIFWCFAPYFIWLLFAFYLIFYVWIYN